MDAETVAGLLGVSERRLRDYVRMGLPAQVQGRISTYNWPEVFAWYLDARPDLGRRGASAPRATAPADPDDAEDITAATRRKTIAEADLKQLALSIKRREVITLADAKPRIERLFTNFRSKALSSPAKIANLLEGAKDRAARETVIREQMETLCRELSTGEILGLPATPDDEPDTLDSLTAAAEEPPVDLSWYGDDDAPHQ